MVDRLKNKTALVTGATSNIGRAIALAFAREGAHVVVGGRDAERANAVVSAIRESGGKANVALGDQDGGQAAAQSLAEEATRLLGGRVDILVNNAGIYPFHTTATSDEAMFDRIFAVNVRAPFFLTQALAPGMAARGGGVIINLGSWITRLGIPVVPIYSASKSAIETLTRTWSAELVPSGVRVNAISPGVVHEPMAEPHPGDVMMKGTPSNHAGSPEAIAHAAVYLASDEASFVHATVLDVDGGRLGAAVVAG